MPAGRPKIYDSPETMQEDIDAYFATCKEEKRIPTVSGLAYALDMTTETLRSYGTDQKFSATVNKAKQLIEISLEERLASNAVAGTIFNLKNNFGWKDRTEVAQEVDMKVSSADKVSDDRLAAIATGGSTATPETPES